MSTTPKQLRERARVLLCGRDAGQWRDALITAGFEVQRCAGLASGESVLEARPHLVVVQDSALGSAEVVAEVRSSRAGKTVPIVVVIGEGERVEEARRAAMEAGADEAVEAPLGKAAVVQAAQMIVGTMVPASEDEVREDAVQRALEAAAAVGKPLAPDEDDVTEPLTLTSSLAQVIDKVEKTYYEVAARNTERSSRDPVSAFRRASMAVTAFCECLGVSCDAPSHAIREAAAHLLEDLDQIKDTQSPSLEALRSALAALDD